MPGDGMSGIVQVLPSFRINSTESKLSLAEPPVTRIPVNIFWKLSLYALQTDRGYLVEMELPFCSCYPKIPLLLCTESSASPQ